MTNRHDDRNVGTLSFDEDCLAFVLGFQRRTHQVNKLLSMECDGHVTLFSTPMEIARNED
jgi:hypothetical protein